MKTCYIYILTDPRNGDVRYVGRTANPAQRMRFHIALNSRNPEKDAWISELKQAGLSPCMVIVEETTSDEWKQREMHWQEHFESIGASLTSRNMRQMAHVLRWREDVREKYRESIIRRWQDPEWRAKMKAVHTGVTRPVGTGDKISAGKKERYRKQLEESGGRIRLQKHTPEIVDLVDPEGNIVPPFRHLREFCEPRGLDPGHISEVLRGKRRSHRGYTLFDSELYYHNIERFERADSD